MQNTTFNVAIKVLADAVDLIRQRDKSAIYDDVEITHVNYHTLFKYVYDCPPIYCFIAYGQSTDFTVKMITADEYNKLIGDNPE